MEYIYLIYILFAILAMLSVRVHIHNTPTIAQNSAEVVYTVLLQRRRLANDHIQSERVYDDGKIDSFVWYDGRGEKEMDG